VQTAGAPGAQGRHSAAGAAFPAEVRRRAQPADADGLAGGVTMSDDVSMAGQRPSARERDGAGGRTVGRQDAGRGLRPPTRYPTLPPRESPSCTASHCPTMGSTSTCSSPASNAK
jgi:hypothetical protein